MKDRLGEGGYQHAVGENLDGVGGSRGLLGWGLRRRSIWSGVSGPLHSGDGACTYVVDYSCYRRAVEYALSAPIIGPFMMESRNE